MTTRVLFFRLVAAAFIASSFAGLGCSGDSTSTPVQAGNADGGGGSGDSTSGDKTMSVCGLFTKELATPALGPDAKGPTETVNACSWASADKSGTISMSVALGQTSLDAQAKGCALLMYENIPGVGVSACGQFRPTGGGYIQVMVNDKTTLSVLATKATQEQVLTIVKAVIPKLGT